MKGTLLIMKELFTIDDVHDAIANMNVAEERYKNSELYKIWLYAQRLFPDMPEHKYLINTNQEYLIKAVLKNKNFEKLCLPHAGLRNLLRQERKHYGIAS